MKNGLEALRVAMGALKFDIIFMDLRMPIMDGQTACKTIKSTENINKSTPVVAVTAYEYEADGDFARVLTKPVSREVLADVLATCCRHFDP